MMRPSLSCVGFVVNDFRAFRMSLRRSDSFLQRSVRTTNAHVVAIGDRVRFEGNSLPRLAKRFASDFVFEVLVLEVFVLEACLRKSWPSKIRVFKFA
jgi:hypothetical protein